LRQPWLWRCRRMIAWPRASAARRRRSAPAAISAQPSMHSASLPGQRAVGQAVNEARGPVRGLPATAVCPTQTSPNALTPARWPRRAGPRPGARLPAPSVISARAARSRWPSGAVSPSSRHSPTRSGEEVSPSLATSARKQRDRLRVAAEALLGVRAQHHGGRPVGRGRRRPGCPAARAAGRGSPRSVPPEPPAPAQPGSRARSVAARTPRRAAAAAAPPGTSARRSAATCSSTPGRPGTAPRRGRCE